jgi:NAD(P)-dependent dehydrogenase (short-subunit alcohol dehydrogenase family)
MTGLKNKVALIAGAGSRGGGVGIGEAITTHLAKQGVKVMGVDMNPDALDITAEMVSKKGYQLEKFIADISSPEESQAAVEHCVKTLGGVDILVNNVGIGRGFGLVETTPEDWDITFQVNAKTAFLMCKAILSPMQERGGGSIINISSMASIRISPIIAYSASKGAMNTMTRHLANRLARYNIRVNAILPGYIDTPLVAQFYQDEKARERDIKKVPLRRLGVADDVASAAVFLASEASSYITGVLLPVDGGITTGR